MPEKPARIMVVDDESRVVNAIRRLFAAGGNYIVEGLTSPLQALKAIPNYDDLRLVLSDYLMPEMDGLTFLSEVQRQRPEVLRLMMTGHADLNTAVRAINEVGVYKFILKPWNNDDLYWTVVRALELEAARRENRQLKKSLDHQERMLSRFEKLYPGITRLDRDDKGAIVIED